MGAGEKLACSEIMSDQSVNSECDQLVKDLGGDSSRSILAALCFARNRVLSGIVFGQPL